MQEALDKAHDYVKTNSEILTEVVKIEKVIEIVETWLLTVDRKRAKVEKVNEFDFVSFK